MRNEGRHPVFVARKRHWQLEHSLFVRLSRSEPKKPTASLRIDASSFDVFIDASAMFVVAHLRATRAGAAVHLMARGPRQ